MARRRSPPQLELFAPTAPAAPSAQTAPPADAPLDLSAETALAARLPRLVRFGTSSWTFPGWGGIVWPGRPSLATLRRDGLARYVQHPLLRTVGIDRSLYAPLGREELAAYAAQLPPGFPCVVKAWDAVTSAVGPDGRENPRFLDADLLEEAVLAPLFDAFRPHVGAVVLQLAPIPAALRPEPAAFADRLAAFLARLPAGFRYAVEPRNRQLLGPAYLQALAAAGAAHVPTFWERMPTVGEQLAIPGVLTAPFVVCRLLLPPGVRYEDARERFEPFDRVQAPSEALRQDVIELALRCVREQRELFILVNNKAEGCAPLTIRAIAERLAATTSEPAGARP